MEKEEAKRMIDALTYPEKLALLALLKSRERNPLPAVPPAENPTEIKD